jgi:hypothetical protein
MMSPGRGSGFLCAFPCACRADGRQEAPYTPFLHQRAASFRVLAFVHWLEGSAMPPAAISADPTIKTIVPVIRASTGPHDAPHLPIASNLSYAARPSRNGMMLLLAATVRGV